MTDYLVYLGLFGGVALLLLLTIQLQRMGRDTARIGRLEERVRRLEDKAGLRPEAGLVAPQKAPARPSEKRKPKP